jgi:hypothetical protein
MKGSSLLVGFAGAAGAALLFSPKRRRSSSGLRGATVELWPETASLGDVGDLRVEVSCAACPALSLGYVRRSAALIGGRRAVWLRMPPQWTLLLPVLEHDPELGVRCLCPLHGFPDGSSGIVAPPTTGAPDPAQSAIVLPPGFYWAWMAPSEWPRTATGRPEPKPYDEFQKKNRGVFRVFKSSGNARIGHMFIFEVQGSDLIWTLPGTPKPAPNGYKTEWAEMTGGLPESEVPSDVVKFLVRIGGDTWSALVD